MGQTTDMAMIADLKKELEREAEEENIPILRRAERKLLLEAAAPIRRRYWKWGRPLAIPPCFWQSIFPWRKLIP